MMTGFRRTLLTGIALLAFSPVLPASAQQGGSGTGINYEARLQTLEEQMRTLNGRIEQVEFGLKRMDQSLQRLQGDVDMRLGRLENGAQPATAAQTPAAPPPAIIAPAANNFVPSTPAAQPAEVNGTLGAIKMQDGRVTGAISNPQSPPLPQTPPDYGLTSQEQYDRAFDLLRQANYDEAGEAFKAFIDKNPQDKLIDNAKYWYGETLYVRGKFDASAVAFADAWQQNPQGNKAPDSLLKLAMSLENIEKVPDACATLDSLKSKYPNASANIRQRGEQERVKLKCGGAAASAPAAPVRKPARQPAQ